jgi:hypothetical protein
MNNGHSRKHPYLPHGGNWKLTPLPPSDVLNPNTLTVIRNNFFSSFPPDGRNFLCGGSVDLFWNDPMIIILNLHSGTKLTGWPDATA